MAHEGIGKEEEEEVDASENENFLREIFEKNKEQVCKGASLAVDLLPFGKWAKLLMKAGINLAQLKNNKALKYEDQLGFKLENLFYTYNSKNYWARFSAEQKTQAIEGVINEYSKQKFTTSTATGDLPLAVELNKIHERARNSNLMTGKDDMITILDTDITILRDITAKSVINAIGLERAFISVVTKNVELIREHLSKGEGAKAFRAWIRTNAQFLMPSQFEKIIEQGAIRENRKAIVNAVKNILNKWNGD